ncbi:MAG: TonB-dependent receptor [Candidatus Aminicenantes bacterium]|nr:MAG: TonB-dependent receptor [Candidatus Aminicenantes bacterium]
MKKLRASFSFIVILLVVTSFVYSQSKETGALKGTVKLEDSSPVPGVLVKLTSDKIVGATKSTITNEVGNYRFVGLQPGIYTLTATLEGFATAKQTGVKVSIGKTFTIDLTMKQGRITEEIVVLGKSALVDVKDSSTATVEMTTDFLQNIPNTQFTVDAVNLAPGITDDVAYGAADGTGIAYQVDGVDVSDPYGGTAWVFLDYHVVEEVSVSGIGAPAEYGNFSGVVFNTITKSGTNQFKGYTEFLYQGKDWNSENSDDPDFAPGAVTFYSAHLDVGGPIIKDKLSFFVSGLYHREIEALPGTDYDRDYWQPKGFFKLTWQPTTKTRLNAFVEYDIYNGKGRSGGATTEEAATVRQDSPEAVGSISLQHLFSDYTFMEAKLAYFSGYYDLIPNAGRDISSHYDWATGWETVNNRWFYRGDRSRLQANASVSHHADEFIKGSHDFKFGAEFIHVTERDRYGFTNGAYYGDWYGEPYWRIEYEGYDVSADMSTVSLYAQDSWSIGNRLTINPGVRMDVSWGGVDDLSGTEYKTKPALAPRIGFTWDLFGDHSTAIKGHWGRYFEGAYIRTVLNLSTAISDWKEYYYDNGEWILDYVLLGGTSLYAIEDKLNQAYMDQLTFGIERELMKDLSLGVTYIWRKNYNHIAPVNIGAQYEQVQYDDPYTGQTLTVWDQTNPRSESFYLITNPKAGDLPWLQFTPYRKYTGIELLLNKRFSHNWQLMASYVYSKANGNFDNTQSSGAGYNTTFKNPNNQIYADGKLSNDYTHMLKIQGSVILPLDINVNVNFQLISGRTYTKEVRLPSSVDVNKTYIWLEPRGSNRYPTSKNLDIRLEKTFKIGKSKVGLLVDVFNVFNEGIVDWYENLATNFEEVLSIVNPRVFRVGLRFWF